MQIAAVAAARIRAIFELDPDHQVGRLNEAERLRKLAEVLNWTHIVMFHEKGINNETSSGKSFG